MDMESRLVIARKVVGMLGRKGDGWQEEDICRDELGLYLDYGGGDTNFHMIKRHKTKRIQSTNADFLVLIVRNKLHKI